MVYDITDGRFNYMRPAGEDFCYVNGEPEWMLDYLQQLGYICAFNTLDCVHEYISKELLKMLVLKGFRLYEVQSGTVLRSLDQAIFDPKGKNIYRDVTYEVIDTLERSFITEEKMEVAA